MSNSPRPCPAGLAAERLEAEPRGLPVRRYAPWLVGVLYAAVALSAPPALAGDPAPKATGSIDQPTKAGGKAPGGKAHGASAHHGNLVGHGGPVKAVRVSTDGRRVLTGSFDYAMTLWDITGAAPREVRRFDDHEGAVNAVAFVPGGKRAIAAGDDGSLWLWDLETGKAVHRFKGHSAKINDVGISADGRYAVSASWDRSARIWDLKELLPGAVLKGHHGPVNAAAFSADGRHVYTAGNDGVIGLWDRASGAYLRPVFKHGWGINMLRRLPGSQRLLWGSLNGAAGIVEVKSGTNVPLPKHERPVLAGAAIAKPGLIATGGGDGVIRVMRIGDWAVIEEYQNPFGPVWALDFIAGGKQMYYGGLDDFATLWQVKPRAAFEPIASKFPRRFQVGGNLSVGERQFARKCSICHTLKEKGRNRAGPTLYKVFGRKAGTLPGYPYSVALKTADIVWNDETIAKLFAIGPEHYTPGTKMPLQKISDPEKRSALIAFLKAATNGVGNVDRAGGSGPAGLTADEGKKR